MTVDAVRQIQAFNAGREAERLQLKYRAMRASPFAFLRGSCHLFYARLSRGGVHKVAPPVWVCGDLHLENFGSYKGDNRLAYFDLNDFDESALAPATWDLIRLLASVQVGAATLAVSDGDARALCKTFVEAYADALALGKAYWVERETATGLVRDLFDDLRGRDRGAFIAQRTQGRGKKRGLRVDGSKALPASAAQHRQVQRFMADFAATQPNPAFFEVLDVARRIAGTGSLGVERFVILVEGKGSPERNYLLDLKATSDSSLAPRLKLAQPAWRSASDRAVAVQRRMQAVPIGFLHSVRFDAKAGVLRGLQPSEDRVRLAGAGHDIGALGALLATMGRLVAWAHLRSAGQGGSANVDELIDFGQRRQWRQPLIAAARECATQVFEDAAAFDGAWDAGAFTP